MRKSPLLLKTKIIASSFAVAVACLIPMTSVAQISVHGSSTAYTETGGDWLTMGANDIDGSGGLGTDGYLFFGIFDDAPTRQITYAEGTPDGSLEIPTYMTFDGPGADAQGRAISDEELSWGLIDDPNFVGAANEGDDTNSGLITSGSGPMGSFQELVVFSIEGLDAEQTVRVGVLAGNQGNLGLFNPIAIRLSDRNNPNNSQTVGSTVNPNNFLDANPGGVNAGWVFFDITEDGDYAVSAAVRVNNQFGFFTSIGGLTFDSVTSTGLCGDVNLSTTVDFADIAPFIALLSTGTFQVEADCNEDGFVTFADIAPFINALAGA